MNVAAVILRIVIFVAIVGPCLYLVVRQVKKAQSMPFDPNLDRQTEMVRGWGGTYGNPPGGGSI